MLTQSKNALQAVKSLSFQSIPVAVTANYRGMFFEEKVAPLKVGPDFIVFRTPKSPLCCALQEKVILHSQVLPESVRTEILSLDPQSCELTLTNFTFTGTLWYDRREQRVEPAVPLKAEISVYGKTYRANLNNLSLHGAGLLVYFGDEIRSDLCRKMPVEISFQLNPQNDFHISGTIASLQQMDYSLLRMVLHLHPSQTQTYWLENYIGQRKIEILHELEQRSADLSRTTVL